MSAVTRGPRNPFRHRVRTAVAVLLLAIIIGLFAVMVQGALATRAQLESLQSNVHTVIELREAGAFGTGGFGEDKPLGSEDFSVATLEQVKRIESAAHIKKIEEYIHAPQIDSLGICVGGDEQSSSLPPLKARSPCPPRITIGHDSVHQNSHVLPCGRMTIRSCIGVLGEVYVGLLCDETN